MNSNSAVFLPNSDEDLRACFPAYLELRPKLTLESFVSQVRRQQSQGFRIVALKVGEQVPCVAGYRMAEFLAWGRVLYIDDLSTLAIARGQGHAGRLLDWLVQQARENACDAVHLDSGYARQAAHRLYLSKGFVLSSHHLSMNLN